MEVYINTELQLQQFYKFKQNLSFFIAYVVTVVVPNSNKFTS